MHSEGNGGVYQNEAGGQSSSVDEEVSLNQETNGTEGILSIGDTIITQGWKGEFVVC